MDCCALVPASDLVHFPSLGSVLPLQTPFCPQQRGIFRQLASVQPGSLVFGILNFIFDCPGWGPASPATNLKGGVSPEQNFQHSLLFPFL